LDCAVKREKGVIKEGVNGAERPIVDEARWEKSNPVLTISSPGISDSPSRKEKYLSIFE